MRTVPSILTTILLTSMASAQCLGNNDVTIASHHLAFGTGCTAPGESGPMTLSADGPPITPPSSQPPFTVLGTLVTYTLTNVPPVVPGTYMTMLIGSFHPIQAGIDLGLFFAGNHCTSYIATMDIPHSRVDSASPVNYPLLIPADIIPVVQLTLQGIALTSTLDIVTSNALCVYINTF